MSSDYSSALSSSVFSDATSSPEYPEQLAELLTSLEAELREHRYFAAASKIRYFEQINPDVDISIVPELDSVIRRMRTVEEVRSLAKSDEAWELQRDSEDIRTFYRHVPSVNRADLAETKTAASVLSTDRSLHSVRIEGMVNCGMLHILALLHETDLFHTWMPSYNFIGLRDARTLDEPSPVELLVEIDVAVPWPVSDRKILLRCTGVDCMQDEPAEIVVLLETPENGPENFPEGVVEAIVLAPSGVVLRPMANGQTFVTVIVNADPQLAIVPSWLVDFAVRNLAFLILVAIRRAVEVVRVGPEYQARIADKENAFYQHLLKRFSEVWPEELKHFPLFD